MWEASLEPTARLLDTVYVYSLSLVLNDYGSIVWRLNPEAYFQGLLLSYGQDDKKCTGDI